MLHDLLTIIAAVASGLGVGSCVRAYIRSRAERARWQSVERLAERHGPTVIQMLPELARELRDGSIERPTLSGGAAEPDADETPRAH